MNKGWIRIFRQIQDCDLWVDEEPFDRRSAWIDLLLSCNHNDKSLIFDGHRMVVKRGQILTSVRRLSERWRWSKDRTLRYLRLLEELEMIERDSNSRRTLLTIVNYEVFQVRCDSNEDTDKDSYKDSYKDTREDTHKPQTINIKNDKNEKNEKNIKKYIYGEYKHVRLSESEYDRLVNDYGEEETHEAIKYLDEYKERKGYKCKNDNLTIRKWVFDAIKEEKTGRRPHPGQNQTQTQTPKYQSVFDAWANA